MSVEPEPVHMSIVLDRERGLLQGPSGCEHLEPKPTELLAFLLSAPGQVHSRKALLDAIWGERIVSDAALTVALGQVRKVLFRVGASGVTLKTYPRRGYELCLTEPIAAPTEFGPSDVADNNKRGSWRWAGCGLLALLMGPVADPLSSAMLCLDTQWRLAEQSSAGGRICVRGQEEAAIQLEATPPLRLQFRVLAMDRQSVGLDLRSDDGRQLLETESRVLFGSSLRLRVSSAVDTPELLLTPSLRSNPQLIVN